MNTATSEYPSYRFSAAGGARLIHSPEQEESGWEDSPAAHGIETAPGAAPDPDIAARRQAAPEPEAEPEPAAAVAAAPAKRKRR